VDYHPMMQTTSRSDRRPAVVRLAGAGALIALLLPLLPVYGDGGRTVTIFSLGLPLRGLLEYLLGRWNSAMVVAVGILFLKRDRLGVAGGVFAAVALGMAITVVTQILITAPHFGRWQTVVVLTLEVVEVILLVLAAVRAIGGPRDGEHRTPHLALEDPAED
jgi:hypothetical protein